MKLLTFTLLLAACCQPQEADNVNCRYKVESVELSNAIDRKVPPDLRSEINDLVGQNFDPQAVTALAQRIRKEVHLVVTHRVERGLQPEHVKVVYEGKPRQWYEEDARVTKLAYHQKQGWTGGLEIGFDIKSNKFEFGLLSDADRLIEREAGINAGFSRPLTDHALLRFQFEALHQQWDPSTRTALLDNPEVPGIYRERYVMEPAVVFLLGRGTSVAAGISVQHFQTQFPAAITEAANAVLITLRHRRRWEPSSSSAGHELDAGYSLRAATTILDTDYVYTRHAFDARYDARLGRHQVTVRALAGEIGGRAPLYERFAIGDSRTLRGWNKFDVDPLGGSRTAYGSVQYMYRKVGVFYDAGSVWDKGEDPDPKQSAGVTVALGNVKGGPYLSIGFPLRGNNFYPLFMMGMNF